MNTPGARTGGWFPVTLVPRTLRSLMTPVGWHKARGKNAGREEAAGGPLLVWKAGECARSHRGAAAPSQGGGQVRKQAGGARLAKQGSISSAMEN